MQDTLRQSPPENKEMKKASLIGVSTTTMFYVLCGCVGYAAFGNAAPGNFLTGFGFYEPFWLIDLANVCIAIHLIGAYQVIPTLPLTSIFFLFNKMTHDTRDVEILTRKHSEKISYLYYDTKHRSPEIKNIYRITKPSIW